MSYQEKTDLAYRQKFGQYFTKKSIRELALKDLPKISNASIVELGCGSGEFIESILEFFPNYHIDAIEIDKVLFDYCVSKYRNVSLFCADALKFEFNKKYDFVIGNPPYFQFKPNLLLKEKYAPIISGRCNIYAFFIKLGIDLLKDGGYLSFVVPTSMLNGAYFAGLRDYILKNCSIVDIKILKEYNSFADALQNVMILVLRKESNNGDFVFIHNGITIFSPEWKELQKIFLGSKSLNDLGFTVKTGAIMWNEHKEKLSTNPNDTLLVWSHNITNKGFVASTKKPQYIKLPPTEKGPRIVVNRVTGMGKQATIRSCLIDQPNFICEKHVNVISGSNLDKLLPHLQNIKAIEVLKKITGNTQVSKTELEKLFPVFNLVHRQH